MPARSHTRGRPSYWKDGQSGDGEEEDEPGAQVIMAGHCEEVSGAQQQGGGCDGRDESLTAAAPKGKGGGGVI